MYTFSQHNNEFYNNGALIHVQAGAEVHVWGDIHMYDATGDLQNNGLIKVQGNAYSDGQFQQSGSGIFRMENSDVNTGERQFISGSYAVRGTQSAIGADDGSYYDLELANDQGIVYLVGTGNVADVRNSVDFSAGSVVNRIITHDVGLVGAITPPANGSAYASVFGLMNSASGLGNLISNTVSTNGNVSGVDNAYIQGKFRRAISPVGGTYGFTLGLEPAGAGAQRGFQYMQVAIGANNYDVITGYFQSGSSNAGGTVMECSGNTMNYWGGVDHGEWVLEDATGTGTGTYSATVWPQDDNFIAAPIWAITKDDALVGTANDCGPSPIGLSRAGFNGFSEFGVSAPISALPIELININATGIVDHIDVIWNVATEIDLSHYELERSEDGASFEYITSLDAVGNNTSVETYAYSDFDVRYFQNYYYRVKSVDVDGSYDYTPIVVANLTKDIEGFDADAIGVFPNPTAGDFMLSIHVKESRNLTLKVFNTFGQLVKNSEEHIPAGNTVMKLASNEWAPGVYYIELTDVNTNETINKRVIKQ